MLCSSSPPVDPLTPLIIALFPWKPQKNNGGIAMKTRPCGRRWHWTCIITLLPLAWSLKRREMFLEAVAVKSQLPVRFEQLQTIWLWFATPPTEHAEMMTEGMRGREGWQEGWSERIKPNVILRVFHLNCRVWLTFQRNIWCFITNPRKD